MIGILGANGFIGRHLANHLINDKGTAPLLLLSRSFMGFPFDLPSSAQKIEADFTQPRSYIDKIIGCETLVLLVTDGFVSEDKNSLPSLEAYQNFLEALSNTNHHVRRLIFASSGGAIYGAQDEVPTSENAPTSPISTYGQAKLAIENEIIDSVADNDWDYTILRIANPVGKWGKRANLISASMQAIAENEPLTIWGDGSNTRDYFDVGELAQAIGCIIGNEKAKNKIYNIGSARGYTINDVLDIIGQIEEKKVPAIYQDARTVDVKVSILNCDKIYKDIGWRAQNTLENVIRKMQDQA